MNLSLRQIQTFVQSDQGLCFLITLSLDTAGCVNRGWRPSETADVPADPNLHKLYRLKDTFLLDADQITL